MIKVKIIEPLLIILTSIILPYIFCYSFAFFNCFAHNGFAFL